MINAYDEIAYPPGAFSQTHPDRLAAHAMLFGLKPTPVDTCSVLEIGAGDGSNLIPMALGAPHGRFVGFDLAAAPVERGLADIEALGLKNIRLFRADILDVDLGDDTFDYIIAHGVYSWVPPHVRDAMMGLVRRRLAPGGVAFVSFNALPGGYVRLAIREELLFSARDAVGRPARMDAALSRLQAWEAPAAEQSPFRRAMAEEAAQAKARPPNGVVHDELSDAYHPVYLRDFARGAAENGMQILAEADPREIGEWFLPAGISDGATFDLVGRAQEADFARVNFFRQLLLTHADANLVRRPRAEFVAAMHVSSAARRVAENRYECEGASFTLADGQLAEVLGRLAAIWPATAPVAELGLDAGRQLALVQLYCLGGLELHAGPSRFSTQPGDRPMASPLARLQGERGAPRLTTLRHTMRDVDDAFRAFVTSLDGTRTRAEIARDIAPQFNLTPEGALAPLGVLLDVIARAPLLAQ
jgi:hypothetical protein